MDAHADFGSLCVTKTLYVHVTAIAPKPVEFLLRIRCKANGDITVYLFFLAISAQNANGTMISLDEHFFAVGTEYAQYMGTLREVLNE